jgi:hypothetical protein
MTDGQRSGRILFWLGGFTVAVALGYFSLMFSARVNSNETGHFEINGRVQLNC